MADEAPSPEARVFWCNTNRGGGAGGNSLELKMKDREFAAVWSLDGHPDGLFNFYWHMWRVRRGDVLVMYAKGVGVIAVGQATESRQETLGPDHPDRLRDYADEGQNELEWRIPVKWLEWDEANPCRVEHALKGAFIEITDAATHGDRLRAFRSRYPSVVWLGES